MSTVISRDSLSIVADRIADIVVTTCVTTTSRMETADRKSQTGASGSNAVAQVAKIDFFPCNIERREQYNLLHLTVGRREACTALSASILRHDASYTL